MTVTNLTWLWLALAGAALWGLQYTMWGYVAKSLDIGSAMFWYGLLTAGLCGAWVLVHGGDFQVTKIVHSDLLWILLGAATLGTLANLGILTGMQLKNATAVTMIECSYPVFTGLFTWLFFRNLQFNATMLLGLACVLVGVGLVAVAQE